MSQRIICIVILIGLWAIRATLQAHNVAQQSVYLGGGSGHFASEEGVFNGCGVLVNAGWQKTLENGQLRLNPELTAGFYNNECTEERLQADYTSLALRGMINYDFIQAGNFAAFIGGGPVFNYTFGDVTNFRRPFPNPQPDLFPIRETQTHVGMAVNIGLRFMPKKGRLGFEMIPVNAQFDFSDYSELIFQARFFYKLDTRKSPAAEKR